MDAYDNITLFDSIETMNPELKHGKGKGEQAYQMINSRIPPRITRTNICTRSSKRRGRRNRQKLVETMLKQSSFKKYRYCAKLQSPIVGYYKNSYFYLPLSVNNVSSIVNALGSLPPRLLPIDCSFKWPRFFEVRTLSNQQFVYQHHRNVLSWTNDMKKALEFKIQHGFNINCEKQRGRLASEVVTLVWRKEPNGMDVGCYSYKPSTHQHGVTTNKKVILEINTMIFQKVQKHLPNNDVHNRS